MSSACIVIGVGAGLGSAVAQRFAAEGFRIGLISRTAKSVDAVAAACSQLGSQTATATADVGDEEPLGSAIEHIVDALGPPSVLVYNAYRLTLGNALSLRPENLVKDFRANAVGALVAAQHVALPMIASGGGTIVFTGGGAALSGSTTWPSLGIGKAALRHLTWDLAEALEPSGVHVATVTICGQIEPNTHFAPALIAGEYWKLHQQERSEWTTEITYR